MSFSLNNKLSFIDSFQFLSSSLDTFIKNLAKDHLKYLSQECGNVLHLVKILVIWFRFGYPYKYMNNFEKFKNNYPERKCLIVC